MEKKLSLYFLVFVCSLVSLGLYMSREKNQTLSIGFMGDIMIGRLVNEVIAEKGYEYPWGDTLDLIRASDLRIINLETTLTQHTEKNPKVFNFRALPDRVKTLKIAGIDVANLANNHILDFKDAGLMETIATLDAADILHIGAGMNSKQAKKPTIISKNNFKIGIIGYTDNELTWKATATTPGTNYIQVGDIKTIKEQIDAIRPSVDIIIVTCQWGPNMRQQPSQEFIHYAHAIIDSGADIIHGHSAHIFQGIELYKNKIILYDTGDFIDDYAVDPALRNDQSFYFEITVSRKGPERVKLTPVIISNMQVNRATGNEKKEIMLKMQQLSKEMNTIIPDDGILIIDHN